jgi:hypothetical protein
LKLKEAETGHQQEYLLYAENTDGAAGVLPSDLAITGDDLTVQSQVSHRRAAADLEAFTRNFKKFDMRGAAVVVA